MWMPRKQKELVGVLVREGRTEMYHKAIPCYNLYELQFQQSRNGLRLDWQLLVHQRQVVPDSLHDFLRHEVTLQSTLCIIVHHLYKQRGSFFMIHDYS